MSGFWRPGTLAPGAGVDREVGREGSLLLLPPGAGAEGEGTVSKSGHVLGAPSSPTWPMDRGREQLLYLLEQHQVLVVVGPPGSGKSARLPVLLDAAGWTSIADEAGGTPLARKLAIALPRRTAAIHLAERVAAQYQGPVGQVVGYSVRFDARTLPTTTRLHFMTTEHLYQELLLDPLLSAYTCILLAEVQERARMTDLLLGVLKKVLRKRPDLRLLLTSSAPYSRDAEHLCAYFNTIPPSSTLVPAAPSAAVEGGKGGRLKGDDPATTAVMMEVPGTAVSPVDLHYLAKPTSNYVDEAIELIVRIHRSEERATRDILLFVTGREEMERLDELLRDRIADARGMLDRLSVYTLHEATRPGELAALHQPAPKGVRRVILATSVAESACPLGSVGYVVDPGFVKLPVHNPATGIESISTLPISQATADQRASIAGRGRPGKAYRLYTQATYQRELVPTSPPEMQRRSLVPVILQLKALGIEDVLHFDYPSAPSAEMLGKGLEVLHSLGILEEYGRLTIPLGMGVAEFPVDPYLATMLWNAGRYGCAEEALTIAAMLLVEGVLLPAPAGSRREVEDGRRKYFVEEGDHLTYVNLYNAFLASNRSSGWCARHHLNYQALLRAITIRGHLARCLVRFGILVRSCAPDTMRLRKCLLSAYFAQCARLNPDGTYSPISRALDRSEGPGVVLVMDRASVLARRSPSFVLYHEVWEDASVGAGRAYMRDVTVVEAAWMVEVAPHFYTTTTKRKRP